MEVVAAAVVEGGGEGEGELAMKGARIGRPLSRCRSAAPVFHERDKKQFLAKHKITSKNFRAWWIFKIDWSVLFPSRTYPSLRRRKRGVLE